MYISRPGKDDYQDYTKPSPGPITIMTNATMDSSEGSKASSTTMEHHDFDPDMSADTTIEKAVLGLSHHDDLCGDPTQVKRDFHGFPLVPQPSRFKDDPLVSQVPIFPIAIVNFANHEYPD
jgi:hypothetical protein